MDTTLQCKGVKMLHSLNYIPDKTVAVKKESFSDEEMNSLDPEALINGDEVLAQLKLEELNSMTPDDIKFEYYEYEEVTIEETGIMDANDSDSDQCSESKDSVSEYVDGKSSNHQETPIHRKPAQNHCTERGKSFSVLSNLRRHEKLVHAESHIAPVKLDQTTTRKSVMYNYRCKICDEIRITMKQALDHYQLKHVKRILTVDKPLICCECKTGFRTAEELRIHSETIHLPKKSPTEEAKSVTCNIYYHSHANKDTLRRHKLDYLQKRYHCKECGKSFHHLQELRCHESSHAKSLFVIFDQATTSAPKVENILQRQTKKLPEIFDSFPVENIRCCGCPTSFDTKEELQVHGWEKHWDTDLEIYAHNRERQCYICFKVFASRKIKDFHRQNVMYNYRCQICDEIVVNLKQAIAHERSQHM